MIDSIPRLCSRCGKNQTIHRTKQCEVCTLKATSRTHFGCPDFWLPLGEKLLEQNNSCPHTGIKLFLGDNASLDHIVAQSKGGPTLMNNLEWVHLWINKIKYDTPLVQFDEDFDRFLLAAAKFRGLI